MITIIKDGNKIRCSQNTYDIMYKRLGYEILDENKKPKVIKTEVVKETIEEKTVTPKPINKGKSVKTKIKKGE